MDMEGRQLQDDTRVSYAPLRRRTSRFAVATARREIHGDLLHRTALPPTLQGFFVGHGHETYDELVEDLPREEYGQFVRLLRATPTPPAVDPSFSFLTKRVLHWTDHIFLLDSCNGLVLFGHLPEGYNTPDLRYIVCNPATEQWTAVPGCGCIDHHVNLLMETTHTSLVFDPAVSSHFHVVLFWVRDDGNGERRTTVHTYSSDAGVWSHSETDWSEEERQRAWEGWRHHESSSHNDTSLRCSPGALVDDHLYLILGRNRVLCVDVQGKTRHIIPAPAVHADAKNHVICVSQFQGLLHCIVEEGCGTRRKWRSYGLSLWVLQDSVGTQEWILKHRMTSMQLFGKMNCRDMHDYHVVTMHPDCNLIFFVRHWDAQLMSYDMDRQEVQPLQSFLDDFGPLNLSNRIILTPYVPYLSELFLGVIGAHK